MAIGLPEIMILAMWAIPPALFFFILYWVIRLAIRHEKRRLE
ncbi:hypothetical protein [Nonomuraea montanisoli]|nr:hypothetical protein [Nonomuraea montanisoli]